MGCDCSVQRSDVSSQRREGRGLSTRPYHFRFYFSCAATDGLGFRAATRFSLPPASAFGKTHLPHQRDEKPVQAFCFVQQPRAASAFWLLTSELPEHSGAKTAPAHSVLCAGAVDGFILRVVLIPQPWLLPWLPEQALPQLPSWVLPLSALPWVPSWERLLPSVCRRGERVFSRLRHPLS